MFDIGHPAHVHYFRNVIALLQQDGHTVLVTSRDKDIAQHLLERYGVPYLSRGRGGRGLIGKVAYLARTDLWMWAQARRFRPHLLVSFGSPYLAHAAWLLGRPHVGITDTEHAVWANRLFVPFSRYVLTPSCFRSSLGSKQVRFDSYMEMAYLAPNRFTPDPTVLDEQGVGVDEPFTIVRFVGWEADHDRGHTGLSLEYKLQAVQEFERFGPVFISSEKSLPRQLERRRSPISVERMHHAMYFARLVYGESATMASEAAVLGTPAIYHDNVGRGYTDEQESRYGLVARFSEGPDGARRGLERSRALLQDLGSKQKAREAAARLHAEKIDTTAYLHQVLVRVGRSGSIADRDGASGPGTLKKV